MSETAAIRTERLTKYYGDFPALVGLDLEVAVGEVVGFLGPNGSGKTTMIRTILDEIRPTDGRAWILGLDTLNRSHAAVLATVTGLLLGAAVLGFDRRDLRDR